MLLVNLWCIWMVCCFSLGLDVMDLVDDFFGLRKCWCWVFLVFGVFLCFDMFELCDWVCIFCMDLFIFCMVFVFLFVEFVFWNGLMVGCIWCWWVGWLFGCWWLWDFWELWELFVVCFGVEGWIEVFFIWGVICGDEIVKLFGNGWCCGIYWLGILV